MPTDSFVSVSAVLKILSGEITCTVFFFVDIRLRVFPRRRQMFFGQLFVVGTFVSSSLSVRFEA